MKTKKIHDSRTALRLPHKQREEIEKLVSEGKFKNFSQLIRAALTEYFSKEGQ